MGIYDRAWYRQGAPRRSAAMTSRVTILIVVNVVCFLLTALSQRSFGWDPVGQGLGLVPDDVVGRFFIWQLITSMFLHGGLFHLFFNMFVLWMFGTHVERRLGPRAFLRFYFGAGLLSGIAYVVFGLLNEPFRPAVGASGAIMGVMVYFTMLNPNATVFLFFLIPMRMVWAMSIIVGIDLYYFVIAPGQTNIAHTAHLGGALFGWLYYRYAHRIDRFFLSLEMRSGKGRKSPEPPNVNEGEVERLLEKISRTGLDSLSERERRFLREASERLRNRER